MMLKKIIILSILLFFIKSNANDFPTLARAEFVFACMSSNQSNRDFMAKCSCAVDEIAKRINFEEYAQAEAIARLQLGASPREEAFKSVGLSKEKMDKLLQSTSCLRIRVFFNFEIEHLKQILLKI